VPPANEEREAEAENNSAAASAAAPALKSVWTDIKKGSVWDVFDKVATLGEGMTGNVYSLRHKDTGSLYAGKSVSKAAMQEALLDDLRNEIGVLITLDHPNVVKLYEVYEDYKEIYLVMEMCTGGELYEALIANDSYGENYAAHLFYQMAAAVAYVHSKKMAHRDLKLENFIFENKKPNSPLKLIDFGLSHCANPDGILRMKSVVGTPYYIAPEVLKADIKRGGKTYNEQCDVWSLGVLLYMLLTGSPPFSGRTDSEIMKAVLRGGLDLDRSPWPSISADAKDIVRKCLTEDPAKRIRAAELMTHPWMKRRHDLHNGKKEEGAIALSGVAKSLAGFRGFSKFKKTAVNLIAFTMTPDKIEELKNAFMACDDNGDGVISFSEFKNGMAGHIPDSDIEDIFRSIDTDGGGTIEYSEFLAAAISKETYMRTDKLRAAWNRLDTDGNGYLDREDFTLMCKDMFGEKELQQMILEADPNGDGKITWEEFLQIMQKDDNKRKERVMSPHAEEEEGPQ